MLSKADQNVEREMNAAPRGAQFGLLGLFAFVTGACVLFGVFAAIGIGVWQLLLGFAFVALTTGLAVVGVELGRICFPRAAPSPGSRPWPAALSPSQPLAPPALPVAVTTRPDPTGIQLGDVQHRRLPSRTPGDDGIIFPGEVKSPTACHRSDDAPIAESNGNDEYFQESNA